MSKIMISKVKFGVWQAIKEAGLNKKEVILLKDLLKKLGNLYVSNSSSNSKKIKELKEKIIKYAKAKNIEVKQAIKELHAFGFISDKDLSKLNGNSDNGNKYFMGNLYLSYCLQIAGVIEEYLYVKNSKDINTIEVYETVKEKDDTGKVINKENKVIEVIRLNHVQDHVQAQPVTVKNRKKKENKNKQIDIDDDIELLNKIKDMDINGEVSIEL